MWFWVYTCFEVFIRGIPFQIIDVAKFRIVSAWGKVDLNADVHIHTVKVEWETLFADVT